jgi:hypothetical protein
VDDYAVVFTNGSVEEVAANGNAALGRSQDGIG